MAEDINVTIDEEETLNVTIDSAISNHDNLTNVTEEQHRTTEQLQDHVATLIDGGTNITINYDDAGDTLTINGSGGGKTEEEIEDIVANALSGSGKASVTYDDANDTITIDVQANQEIDVQDSGSSVGTDPAALNFGTDLSATFSGGTATINNTAGGGGGGGQWTLDGTLDLQNSLSYTLSDTYQLVNVQGYVQTEQIDGFTGLNVLKLTIDDHSTGYDYIGYDGGVSEGKSNWQIATLRADSVSGAYINFTINGESTVSPLSYNISNRSSIMDGTNRDNYALRGWTDGSTGLNSVLNTFNFSILELNSGEKGVLKFYGRKDF